MSYEFKLEDPGEGIHEAEILEVLVKEGDTVEAGDDVLVAETDKAAVEIPSPVAGMVSEIKVKEGDIVNVGDVLMVFDEEGAEAEKEKEPAEEKEKEEKEKEEEEEEEEKAKERKAEKAEKTGAKEETEGKGGKKRAKGPVPATPAVRGLAKELGVDLKDVEGSGEDGRILKADVRGAAGEGEKEKEGRRPREKKRPALPDFEKWGEVERVELRSIRRAIANRMEQSWREIPHVTHQDEIDITELEQLRRAHYDEIEKRGGHLTLTPFFVKALVAALKQHPRFNASLDPESEEIVLKHYYNIGVALDSDRGLLVPVLHDADKKSIAELAVDLTKLAGDVREGNASQDQLRGGTFSLTNIGSLGGTQFSPIINYPEAAIFGTARAQLKPVIKGDLDSYEVEARLILPVCVAFDHRINDGADAARFMDTVKSVLSDPEEMILMG